MEICEYVRLLVAVMVGMCVTGLVNQKACSMDLIRFFLCVFDSRKGLHNVD